MAVGTTTYHMEKKTPKRLNPQKFALWVGMASMLMFFGAFTSAYIVKQGAGNWLEFVVPSIFYVSTAVLLASSFTLHRSFNAFKNANKQVYQLGLVISLILGLTFIIMQYVGWQQMFASGVDLKINVAGSFFYIITGSHAAHVIGGITAIIVAVIHAFTLPFEVPEFRKNRFELVVHFWHFIDVLWIYLFIFLLFVK